MVSGIIEKQYRVVAYQLSVERELLSPQADGQEGGLVAFIPLADLLLVDSVSFLLSAVTLGTIRRRFNASGEQPRSQSIRQDIAEGLRYVLSHPVLRNISLMMALVNFVGATAYSQLVCLAKQRMQANDTQVGRLYSAGSVGARRAVPYEQPMM